MKCNSIKNNHFLEDITCCTNRSTYVVDVVMMPPFSVCHFMEDKCSYFSISGCDSVLRYCRRHMELIVFYAKKSLESPMLSLLIEDIASLRLA